MPDIRSAVTIALVFCIVACDAPAEHAEQARPLAPVSADTTTDETTVVSAADSSSGSNDAESTAGEPADRETSGGDEISGGGSTTTSDDDGVDTFPPTTTAHFDHTTGGIDDDGLCHVDIVLSIDAATASRWTLLRLSNQVIVADGKLRDAGVQARWIVIPWVDTVSFVDTLEGWTGDVDAYAAAAAVKYYADYVSTASSQLAPVEGFDEDPDIGAGLDALAIAAAWDGWRPGATRWAVHVASSAIVEPPTAPGGFPAANTYDATRAALEAAQVRVLAWAPAGAPGYAAPYGDAPALSYAWHDLASESGVPDALPPTGSEFAAKIVADVVAGSCIPDAP